MTRMLILAMAFATMVFSLEGCFWWHGHGHGGHGGWYDGGGWDDGGGWNHRGGGHGGGRGGGGRR